MKKKDLQSSSLPWEQTDNFWIPSSTLEFMATGSGATGAAGLGKLQGLFEIHKCLLYSVGNPESSSGAEEVQQQSTDVQTSH